MKKGLGRGLGELLSLYDNTSDEVKNAQQEQVKEEEKEPKVVEKIVEKIVEVPSKDSGVQELDINLVDRNPNQPRKDFNEDALKELASSIKIHGIIQPIIVNKQDNGRYMIIAGERRWRAAKIADLKTVPCVVKTYTEKQVKEISLIENLQREDLNPIEAARAIKELMEEYSYTQETVADRLGKSRPAIANTLRLLTLCPEVIAMIEKGELSSGHARCLVVIEDKDTQLKFAIQAKEKKLSVREFEKLIKDYLNPKAKEKPVQSIELKELVNEMQRTFATKVSILGNDNKGRIYIDYYNKDDLDRIAQLLNLIKNKTLTLQDLSNFNKIK